MIGNSDKKPIVDEIMLIDALTQQSGTSASDLEHLQAAGSCHDLP
jgi:hypothetical protein